MAYRELHVIEIKELLRLWAAGYSLRDIARRTRIDRKTLRRHIDVAKQHGLTRGDTQKATDDAFLADVLAEIKPGAPATIGAMRLHCRAHTTDIQNWVSKGCRGPKVARLLYRTTGVHVPLRTLQRFITEEINAGKTDTVRIVEPDPGLLEADFLQLGDFTQPETGKATTLYALLLVAAFSRHMFLWPCLSQTRDDVIEGLEAAWDFFGGVFPILLPDNLKPVIDRHDPVDPRINPRFLEYAQHADFLVDPARVRKPKDKAKVERQVRYARDDFFRGERFLSLEQCRQQARHWCNEQAGLRIHGRTQKRPREVFEALEKAHLKPLPATTWETPCWGEFQVGRDHALVVGKALYSVPYTLGRCTVQVRWDAQTVKVYHGGQLVKLHPRQSPGGTHIDAVDLPPGKAELATRDAGSLCERALAMGPHIGEYARRLAEGPLPWSRMRHIYRLLGLVKRYGAAATDEACARALEVDVVEVIRIDRMLQKGLERRALLTSAPLQPPPQGQVLRFARPAAAFRGPEGGDDASA